MAETLVELQARITADATELKSGLTDAEGKTEQSSKRMADSLKKVGIAMAAAGAAITAAMGLAVKSAMDAVESENLFTVSLKNNADEARKWSNELGRSLGLNTFELRKNVGVMFTMISSMGVAEDAAFGMSKGVAELAHDMASFYNLPVEEAFNKIKSGLVGMPRPLQDLGILVNETTIKTWALTNGIIAEGQEMTEQQKVQARYGAILQATSDAQGDLARTIDSPTNKLRILGSAVDELRIVIGENLLPIVGGLLKGISEVVAGVMDWIKEHPALAKVLTLVALGVGAVLTVVGGLILAIPVITSLVAAFGVVFHVALGPIGLISLAIAALIAVGILLWKNWDKVVDFLRGVWINLKIIFAEGVKFIVNTVLLPFVEMVSKEIGIVAKGLGKLVGLFNKDAGDAIEGFADKMLNARKEISDWADGIVDAAKASKEFRKTEEDIKRLTETITAEFRKQADEIQASYDTQRAESRKAYDDAVEAINKEYGIGEAAKEVSETKIDAAKRATTELKASYEREKGYAKDRYDFEIEKLNDAYDLKIKNLDRDTDATIKALQDQIDAIDEQTEAEELAITRAEEAKRLAELKGAYDSAITAEDKARAKEEWDKYAAEVARKELLRTRNDEKDALRDSIERTREEAKNEKDRLKETLDANIQTQKDILTGWNTHYINLGIVADTDLANNLVRIETDRLAAITAQQEILTETLKDIKIAEETDIQALADQLERAHTQVKEINSAYDNLTKRYDIEIVTHQITVSEGGREEGATAPIIPGETYEEKYTRLYGVPPGAWEGFQRGGIVTQPTLAMIGEAGPEAVIPLNEAIGGITINFTQPVFFDREDQMNKFVDMIRKGIQRQDRLRFGGAYSG